MSNKLAEVRPDLLYADQFKELKDYLLGLPLTRQEKKELLVEWCEATRVRLHEKLVKDVGGV